MNIEVGKILQITVSVVKEKVDNLNKEVNQSIVGTFNKVNGKTSVLVPDFTNEVDKEDPEDSLEILQHFLIVVTMGIEGILVVLDVVDFVEVVILEGDSKVKQNSV